VIFKNGFSKILSLLIQTVHHIDHLKLFFDNWKDRNPMLLVMSGYQYWEQKYLIKQCISKGIIKKYLIDPSFIWNNFENFKWV
jgi:hypothetical protein